MQLLGKQQNYRYTGVQGKLVSRELENRHMTSFYPTIAIDGPSASGKGTIARRLAEHFNFAHLDTGILYRGVALAILRAGGDPNNELTATQIAQSLNFNELQAWAHDPALRSEAVSAATSKASQFPAVRAALHDLQVQFWQNPPSGKRGAVLDGRDIGTVIAPDAPVKLFITASPEVRADRRSKELQARGENVNSQTVLAELLERDARDSQRAIAQAKPAADAVIIDTTTMTADEAFATALAIARQKLSQE